MNIAYVFDENKVQPVDKWLYDTCFLHFKAYSVSFWCFIFAWIVRVHVVHSWKISLSGHFKVILLDLHKEKRRKKKRSHFISSETILSKNTFRLIDTCLEVPWNLNLFPLMLRIMSRLTMNRKCVCSDVCISVAFMYQHTFSIASQFCCRKNRQAPFGWLNLRYYLIAEHALYLSISWLIKGWWSLINLNRMCDWRAINQYSMWMHIRHTMQCDLKQKDIIQ